MSVALEVAAPELHPAIPPFPVHRFSVQEYHELGRHGVLTADDRVELLEGWIVAKMTINPPHGAAIGLCEQALRAVLPAGWYSRIQLPITLSDSEPEPDLAVVTGGPRDYARRHPGPDEAGLVIEVADTSLQRDREKCRIYARAGISTYWIVNLLDQCVEVHTQPSGASRMPRYQRHEVVRLGAMVPLFLGGTEIARLAVSNLMPYEP
jgi:Uma2 family endonuclease